MRQYTTSFGAAGLIAAVLTLPGASAANLGDIASEQVFFSVGGPAGGSANTAAQDMTPAATPAALPNASLFTSTSTPDEQVREHPIGQPGSTAKGPDPSLFTPSNNPNEQNIEHAFDLFGLLARKKQAAAPTTPTTDAKGQVAATRGQPTAEAPKSGPDPSLFTNVPNPDEQTRDHPISLF